MSEAVVRWKLVATGKVQIVGYRERVALEAEKRGIVGSVANDEKDERRVLIEAQGVPEVLEAFRRAILPPEGRSVPREVARAAETEADTKLTEFRVVRGNLQLETLERLEQGNRVLGSMDRTLGSMDQRLGSIEAVGRETLGVSKETLGVAKENLAVSKEGLAVGKETLGVGRETLAAVREGNRSLATKLTQGNANLGSRIETVGRKVDGVAAAVREEGRNNTQFRHELSGAVLKLESKYGAISKTLSKIDRDLQAQTRALLVLAKAISRSVGRPAPTGRSGASGRRGGRSRGKR